MNALAKYEVGWVFFADYFSSNYGWVVALLALLLGIAIVRARKSPVDDLTRTKRDSSQSEAT
jgi:hypothetical protein